MTGNTKTGHLTSMAPFYIFAVALLVVGLIIAAFIRVPKKDEDVASAEEIKRIGMKLLKSMLMNFRVGAASKFFT